MTAARITIDDADVVNTLAAIRDRTSNMKPAMGEIAGILENNIKLTFTDGTSPYGQPWVPLKHRDGQPLLNTNRLRDSISSVHDEKSADASTNVEYAAPHQFGQKQAAWKGKAEVKAHTRVIAKVFGRPIEPRSISVRQHTRSAIAPWGDVPARPFFPIQNGQVVLPDDWKVDLLDVLSTFITRGVQ